MKQANEEMLHSSHPHPHTLNSVPQSRYHHSLANNTRQSESKSSNMIDVRIRPPRRTAPVDFNQNSLSV